MDKKISPLPLLVDALRLLPVQPLKERDAFGESWHLAKRTGSSEIHGVPVGMEELQHLFVQDDGTAPRISPDGATVLLRLYREGAFVHSDRKPAPGGIELLEAYAEGRASIVAYSYWAKPRRTGVTRRRPVEQPEVVTPTPTTSVHHSTMFASRFERQYRVTTHRLT